MAVKFASAIDAASWNHLERAEIGPKQQAARLELQRQRLHREILVNRSIVVVVVAFIAS